MGPPRRRRLREADAPDWIDLKCFRMFFQREEEGGEGQTYDTQDTSQLAKRSRDNDDDETHAPLFFVLCASRVARFARIVVVVVVHFTARCARLSPSCQSS